MPSEPMSNPIYLGGEDKNELERVKKARSLFKIAAQEPETGDLRKAIINRIAMPSNDEKAEFESLMKLFVESQAYDLSENIIKRHHTGLGNYINQETDPELML